MYGVENATNAPTNRFEFQAVLLRNYCSAIIDVACVHILGVILEAS